MFHSVELDRPVLERLEDVRPLAGPDDVPVALLVDEPDDLPVSGQLDSQDLVLQHEAAVVSAGSSGIVGRSTAIFP